MVTQASHPTTSPYRWVVLAAFALLNAVIQLQWLTFAPIAREARAVYHASAWQIDALSLVFMAVFVVVAIPASYVIDTFGLRIGVGAGAVLTAIFAALKGLAGPNYGYALAAQLGLAVAQPFVVNAATKLASQWFPIRERAIAVGLATVAQFLGIVVVMIVTPLLVEGTAVPVHEAAAAIHQAFLIYAGATGLAVIATLLLLRERPPTPPGPAEVRVSVSDGLKFIARDRGMRTLLCLFLLAFGIFNAISTCIDQICEQKGLSVEQTGLVGGLMLIAGILGAVVIPLLSDKLRQRRLFLLISAFGMMPGLLGLAMATGYHVLLVSSFVFGFFLLGGGAPIGFQYAAEISFPAPESTAQGLILMAGQLSGMLFIVLMNLLGTGVSMWIFVGFGAGIVALSLRLNESPVILIAGAVAPAPGRDE